MSTDTQVRLSATKALVNGYGRFASDADGTARRHVVISVEGNCLNPVPIDHWSDMAGVASKAHVPWRLSGFARCRKCDNCRNMRSYSWLYRARAEYARWPLTLFGTVTMSPEQHYELDARLTRRLFDGGTRLSDLDPAQLFAARVKEFGYEMQKYLKRIRKGAADRGKPSVRYLLVAEAHDGEFTSVEMRFRPHFHLLIHEMRKDARLVLGSPLKALADGEDGEFTRKKYRDKNGVWRTGVFAMDDAWIRQQWPYGHTKFQFAETPQAASYLCKYLSKEMTTRIRASSNYGDVEHIDALARSVAQPLSSLRKEKREDPTGLKEEAPADKAGAPYGAVL